MQQLGEWNCRENGWVGQWKGSDVDEQCRGRY